MPQRTGKTMATASKAWQEELFPQLPNDMGTNSEVLPMSWRNDRHDMINWTTKRGRWRWVTPIRSDLRAWLYQLPNVSLSDSGMYLLMMKEFGPTHEVFIAKPWKHVSKIRSLYANWPSWPQLVFFRRAKIPISHLQRHVSKAQLPHIKKKTSSSSCEKNIANSSLTSLPFPRLWRFQWILAKARNQRTDTKDQKWTTVGYLEDHPS